MNLQKFEPKTFYADRLTFPLDSIFDLSLNQNALKKNIWIFRNNTFQPKKSNNFHKRNFKYCHDKKYIWCLVLKVWETFFSFEMQNNPPRIRVFNWSVQSTYIFEQYLKLKNGTLKKISFEFLRIYGNVRTNFIRLRANFINILRVNFSYQSA